jgi:hypothetical protein
MLLHQLVKDIKQVVDVMTEKNFVNRNFQLENLKGMTNSNCHQSFPENESLYILLICCGIVNLNQIIIIQPNFQMASFLVEKL